MASLLKYKKERKVMNPNEALIFACREVWNIATGETPEINNPDNYSFEEFIEDVREEWSLENAQN